MDLIQHYLDSKKNSWSVATQRSEKYRLNSLRHLLSVPLNPPTIWEGLRGMSSYTRLIAFTRIIDFYKLIDQKHAEVLIKWRSQNAQLFRHAYKRKTPEIGWEEAKKKIEGIKSDTQRIAASHLLYSGLRADELNSIDNRGNVIGKGNKQRRVPLNTEIPLVKTPYYKLYKALKKVGLKPHDLRKIRATDVLRRGLDLPSICDMFGWSNLNTAKSYMAPLATEKIKELLERR